MTKGGCDNGTLCTFGYVHLSNFHFFHFAFARKCSLDFLLLSSALFHRKKQKKSDDERKEGKHEDAGQTHSQALPERRASEAHTYFKASRSSFECFNGRRGARLPRRPDSDGFSFRTSALFRRNFFRLFFSQHELKSFAFHRCVHWNSLFRDAGAQYMKK